MSDRFTLLLIFFFACFSLQAQIPAGYYNSADGLTGTNLRAALHDIINGHTSLSYSSLENYMELSDVKPGNIVWDIYSDRPGSTPPYTYHYVSSDQCGNYNGEGDCWNKEHSWPQSWFNSASPMQSDLFHLYPTDGFVNGKRGNYPFGTVSNPTWTSQNGSKLGNCSASGYSGIVFEPINEYKGDLARSYFYMCTRYYTEDGSWNVNDMVDKANLKPWALALLKQWHESDTVSQKEIDRNNIIYGFQNNRNPFIDHPEWVAAIWGGASRSGDMMTESNFVAVFPNPASDIINVRCTISGISKFSFQIINLVGEVIFSAFIYADETQVPVVNIPEGTYFVRVSDQKNRTFLRKLVIIN